MRGATPDRVPVFPLLMSIAADRHGISYKEFASNYNALAEAQINITERFDIDAVTVCSDAFRVTADLGGKIYFPLDAPPRLTERLISSEADFKKLGKPDTGKGRMFDRIRAAETLAKRIGTKKYLCGWVDMPFAEACSTCGVSEFMYMLYDEPLLAHRILEFFTGIVIDFALAQVEAGCDIIGCGDAAASLVSRGFYTEFALPYEQAVTKAVRGAGKKAKLHICGDTDKILDILPQSGCELFSIDHMVDLRKARDIFRCAGLAFKGNLNPVLLISSTETEVRKLAADCIGAAKGASYMLSAGCEIPAATPDNNLKTFCESVK